MFVLSFKINGKWSDQFTTNRPMKDLFASCEKAKAIEGCDLCGIFNPQTRELMCYARP